MNRQTNPNEVAERQFRQTLSEVGLNEVLIHSQCIAYIRWPLAHLQFGETDSPNRKLSNVLLWMAAEAIVFQPLKQI